MTTRGSEDCPLSTVECQRFPNTLSCPVSGDPLNPANMMPSHYSSLSGVPDIISTKRISSSIPRTGSSQTWQYPSPAMFYSATERKGHFEAVQQFKQHPEDVSTIVHIHNIVNEKVWREILKFEKLREGECKCKKSNCVGPSLASFVGKPNELSLKAKMMCFFGYTKPFDRHDWYVNRCGKSVRYIIDFYNGSPKPLPTNIGDQKVSSTDETILMPSIYLDVRPAMSMEGVMDRIKMQCRAFFNI